MGTITKKELVARISTQTGQTKVVTKDILQRFLDEIITELAKGNRLEFREFGVFEIKERPPRRAQNPRTLEKVDVPAKKVVKFKVGRLMKERVGIGRQQKSTRGGRTSIDAATPCAAARARHAPS
jgi:integration host factor subunit beta